MVAGKLCTESRISQSLLAVDPGVYSGWAFWPKGKKYPTRCGVIEPNTNLQKMKKLLTSNKEIDFFDKMHSTIHQLGKITLNLKPEFVVVEWPQSFTSVGGRAATGAGSIIKLAFGIGQVALMAYACQAKFVPVPVAQWKGNLSKQIVIKRIKKRLTQARLEYLEPSSHAWDAIGIGLFCKGLF